jgi:predicted glycoside hydrolase/deacetylase ChbG (UPF0249 family)
MKLIIQSDDLGITQAVSCGIERAVRDGVVTCTGLFSNMESAEFAVGLMRAHPEVCLGEDINLVAGKPCSDPEKIPSLVQPNGYFKTSGMHRAQDAADHNQDHVIFDECLIEVEAQILRFMELTGKKPEYLHGHSYSTPAVVRAMEIMGEKYEIPLVRHMMEKYHVVRFAPGWNQKPFALEDQMKADPLGCIVNNQEFLKNEIGFIGTHCGYVDDELFRVSTYTLIRNRDLAAMISDQMKQWIKENQIEVISYRDLLAE